MKIVIDECLPKRVVGFFPDDEAWTVPQIGLNGYKDAELLDELNNKNIDIFITIDGNIEYQQQFTNRFFGTVIIRAVSNRYADLKHHEEELRKIIKYIKPSQIVHIPD